MVSPAHNWTVRGSYPLFVCVPLPPPFFISAWLKLFISSKNLLAASFIVTTKMQFVGANLIKNYLCVTCKILLRLKLSTLLGFHVVIWQLLVGCELKLQRSSTCRFKFCTCKLHYEAFNDRPPVTVTNVGEKIEIRFLKMLVFGITSAVL